MTGFSFLLFQHEKMSKLDMNLCQDRQGTVGVER
jgi:hypothetical protein